MTRSTLSYEGNTTKTGSERSVFWSRASSVLGAGLLAGALSLLGGCSSESHAAEKPLDPALTELVLRDVPSDMANSTYIDFGSKVTLVGYSLGSPGPVHPGDRLELTLYWQAKQRLSEGFQLVTHLLGNGGRQLTEAKEGALRSALPPSDWQPGLVYVDKQVINVPRQAGKSVLKSSELTLAVSIEQEGSKLQILSGPRDREQRGIITHVSLDASRITPPSADGAEQRGKGRAGRAGRPLNGRRPGGPGGPGGPGQGPGGRPGMARGPNGGPDGAMPRGPGAARDPDAMRALIERSLPDRLRNREGGPGAGDPGAAPAPRRRPAGPSQGAPSQAAVPQAAPPRAAVPSAPEGN